MTEIPPFPEGFLWGVATSSHQIEGGYLEGQRGESIWDRYAATPGKIEDGSNASVACDHFHRWKEDIELMRWLGVGAYRFSIAWPRILPGGRGRVREEGLDFYDRLVDGLLQAKIDPFITLYHWDLPQVLQDLGGWGVRETAEAFVEYTDAVTRRLGDRVRHWMTHNEPWCIATLGHEEGHHAPGHQDPAEALRVAHHLLLSHGWATGTIRRNSPGAEVGIVLNLVPAHPASESAADLDAVRRFDGQFNRWYLDPLFRGCYPADAVEDRVRRGHLADAELPFLKPRDLADISVPIDFLGVNYYSRVVVRADETGDPVAVDAVPRDQLTDMGWEVYPQGLESLLLRLVREYSPPGIYITENGAAYTDVADADGRIADQRRIDYLREHFAACARAIQGGVPLFGHFVWSFMDNFEWGQGYARRFGLYDVDRVTLNRIPRDSAFWFREVVAANGAGEGARQHS